MRAVPTILLVCAFVIQVLSQRFRPEQSNVRQPIQEQLRPSGSGYSCPEKDGRYAIDQCDNYIECRDGIPEKKLCPDGLLFNPAVRVFADPCQYPIDVDCTGRERTQPPQPTEDCPHQFGYFRIGDQNNCGQFMNCANGRGYTFDCPEGLAYNENTYKCDWADQVPTCDAEAYLGFSCPPEANVRGLGEPEYRFFRNPTDCQRYFLCVRGRPRVFNCGAGSAFDDIRNECDGVENVTGCSSNYEVKYDKSAINPRYKSNQG